MGFFRERSNGAVPSHFDNRTKEGDHAMCRCYVTTLSWQLKLSLVTAAATQPCQLQALLTSYELQSRTFGKPKRHVT